MGKNGTRYLTFFIYDEKANVSLLDYKMIICN